MTNSLGPRLSSLIRFAGRLSVAATQILTLTILTWVVLRFYPGDRWLAVRLGSYFAPWLFLALFPMVLIAIIDKRLWLTGLIMVLVISLGVRYAPMLAPQLPRVQAQNETNTVRVMTFNVHYSNRNVVDIANLIRAEKPDIVAFQEINSALRIPLLTELSSEYPYQIFENPWGLQMAFLSRYPLMPNPQLPDTSQVIGAVAETPYGSVNIWNIHPSPGIIQRGWAAQRHTLTNVSKTITDETGPLIVLGDFNTTDQAENYSLIAEHLTDVHEAVGHGFGFTFPNPDVMVRIGYGPFVEKVRPVVRIDHILVSDHFEPQETHVVPHSFGSDHRPVVATLRFSHQ